MRKTLISMALAGCTLQAVAQDDFKWQPFYTQTYENVNAVSDVWTSPSNQGGLSLVTEENGNHYVNYNSDPNHSGGRALYNLDALTDAMYNGIDEYRLEFDLALQPSSYSKSFTQFAVGGPDIQTMGKDWVTPCGNITSYPNNGLGSGALFALFQESANSTSWHVYSQAPVGNNNYIDDETTEYRIELASGTWYHFAITVSPVTDVDWTANVTAEVTDMDGNLVMFNNTLTEEDFASVTLPYCNEGSGYWFKQFYILSGRGYSGVKIDNIQVMKKAEAGSVTPPTLAMTGVQMEGRIVSLDNGAEADQLTPYYAVVDEATYEAAESTDGLTATEYTVPFVVSEAMNYILAWNVDENGKASELTKFTVEAGWIPQLNAPTITAIDYDGANKTYTATCYQSDVLPLAPLSYTIYMSTDGVEWIESNTITATEGKVYAKVESDGYGTNTNSVYVPDGNYIKTRWSVAGMVISNQDCILESTGATHLNFGNSGNGRVHLSVQYWSEDYVSEYGETTYDAENAWAPLKKNGFHFNGGTGDMFLLGSGNANGYTINGLCVYYSNKGYIKIDNLHVGDFVKVEYSDGSSQMFTVGNPETFQISIPKYGSGAIATILTHRNSLYENDRLYMLNDLEAYTNNAEIAECDVRYTRTFNNTNWQPLYIPFSMNYDEWSDWADVAEINDVHQFFGDGETVTVIEFRTLNSGQTRANTPYVIRVHEDAVPLQTPFSKMFEDKTLYAAANGTVDCASAHWQYTLTGVYESYNQMMGKYALNTHTGQFTQGASNTNILNPQRFYLEITSRDGGYGYLEDRVAPVRVFLSVDGEATHIEGINASCESVPAPAYNMQGIRVGSDYKGIVIVEGKKMMRR